MSKCEMDILKEVPEFKDPNKYVYACNKLIINRNKACYSHNELVAKIEKWADPGSK